LLDAVSGCPSTAITSFNATGIPSSTPRASPRARRASEASACFNASASSNELNACTRGSTAFVRSMTARVSSIEDSCFASSADASSAMGR